MSDSGWGSMIGEAAGSLAGEAAAAQNDANIQRLLTEMMRRWESLPDAEKVAFEPLLRSALNEVSMDPRLQNIQNRTLDRLMEMSEGGLTDADRAKLEESKLAALDYERGVRGRDEQLLKRRGLANSGAILAGQLDAAQEGIDRAYKGDVMTAAASSGRALEALLAGGAMAERMGARDVDLQSRAAAADDLISRFNASRADEMEMYNSSLDQRNALARLGGLDRASGLAMGIEDRTGERTRRKWRGYGKSAGAAYDKWDAENGF